MKDSLLLQIDKADIRTYLEKINEAESKNLLGVAYKAWPKQISADEAFEGKDFLNMTAAERRSILNKMHTANEESDKWIVEFTLLENLEAFHKESYRLSETVNETIYDFIDVKGYREKGQLGTEKRRIEQYLYL